MPWWLVKRSNTQVSIILVGILGCVRLYVIMCTATGVDKSRNSFERRIKRVLVISEVIFVLNPVTHWRFRKRNFSSNLGSQTWIVLNINVSIGFVSRVSDFGKGLSLEGP